jgi:hypothetical protein
MSGRGRKTAKRGQKEAPPPKLDLIALLPCVKTSEEPGGGRNFWTVARTGNYEWDGLIGKGLAFQVLKTMQQGLHHELLRNIIGDMVRGGTFSGVEVGFMGVICFDIAKRDIMARMIQP